jgi:hypothetical protein
MADKITAAVLLFGVAAIFVGLLLPDETPVWILDLKSRAAHAMRGARQNITLAIKKKAEHNDRTNSR